MTVAELLKTKSKHVVTILPDAKLADAARLLTEERVGLIVVVERGRGTLLGVVSERDLVGAFATLGPCAFERTVRDVMTTNVFACAPEQTLEHLLMTMTARRVRHLPAIKDGRLLGIVSMGDLVVRLLHDVVHAPGARAV